MVKQCKYCEEEKPTTEFYNSSGNNEKVGSYCKDCSSAIGYAWKQINKEKTLATSRRYYDKNKEKRKQETKDWNAKHPDYQKNYQKNLREKRKQNTKEWNATHPEYQKKWREENPDYQKNYQKDDKNKEKRKQNTKEWNAKHPDYQKNYQKKWREEHPTYLKDRLERIKNEGK